MEDSYNPEEIKINNKCNNGFWSSYIYIYIAKSQGDLMTLTCFSQTPDNYSSQSWSCKKYINGIKMHWWRVG